LDRERVDVTIAYFLGADGVVEDIDVGSVAGNLDEPRFESRRAPPLA